MSGMGKARKCRTVGKTRVCKFGGKTVVFHEGKSNKAAKKARGRALHKEYECERSKRTGRFTSCTEK